MITKNKTLKVMALVAISAAIVVGELTLRAALVYTAALVSGVELAALSAVKMGVAWWVGHLLHAEVIEIIDRRANDLAVKTLNDHMDRQRNRRKPETGEK